jgi:hypothetical protein
LDSILYRIDIDIGNYRKYQRKKMVKTFMLLLFYWKL